MYRWPRQVRYFNCKVVQLDDCDGTGKVALVYRNNAHGEEPAEASPEVWFADRAGTCRTEPRRVRACVRATPPLRERFALLTWPGILPCLLLSVLHTLCSLCSTFCLVRAVRSLCEGNWTMLADSFTRYFRLLILHLGLPDWQYV